MKVLRSLRCDERGSSSVELILSLPLLTILLFGTVELGHYFYLEHEVIRGTREAARYAARKVTLPEDSCPDVTPVETETLARLTDSAPAVSSWTGSTVTIDCDSGFTTGLYAGGNGYDASSGETGPVLTVSAQGTAPTFFSFLGFVDSNWTITAKQHAAVIGW